MKALARLENQLQTAVKVREFIAKREAANRGRNGESIIGQRANRRSREDLAKASGKDVECKASGVL